MNKREERKLRVGFIMISGVLLASCLHSKWGFSWILSLILGFSFIAVLWIGLVWVTRKVFSE